ncbi:hypothetical protein CFOL_v3_00856 [Cephalotus follicularis]|uniref:DUF7138 domain-containing protein n=1 Tax=Cephalotus follicularis TaxID=3775 RepID=A0A1Q3ANK2_CEPFO|nr:hypothetical protein CFOL_v3_00856 [Cephalotus follicularis]
MALSAGVPCPVVFNDGETEMNIGNLVVYPSTNFKGFQSALSHKIGISPTQFTVYLVDGRKFSAGGGVRFSRRIPVTAKSNFSAISREGESLFLVVLKRSRRDRRRQNTSDDVGSRRWDPPANMRLLRRNESCGYGMSEEVLARSGGRNRRNERYVVNMGLDGLSLGPDESGVVCEECLIDKKMGSDVVGFHRCVQDAVTFGFRSPAGPIARPNKSE